MEVYGTVFTASPSSSFQRLLTRLLAFLNHAVRGSKPNSASTWSWITMSVWPTVTVTFERSSRPVQSIGFGAVGFSMHENS